MVTEASLSEIHTKEKALHFPPSRKVKKYIKNTQTCTVVVHLLQIISPQIEHAQSKMEKVSHIIPTWKVGLIPSKYFKLQLCKRLRRLNAKADLKNLTSSFFC